MPYYTYELNPDDPDSELIELETETREEADEAFSMILRQMAGGGQEAPPAPQPGVEEAAGPPQSQNTYGPNPYDPAMLSGFPGMVAIPDEVGMKPARAIAAGLMETVAGYGQLEVAFQEKFGNVEAGTTKEFSRRSEEFLDNIRGPDPTGRLADLQSITGFGANLALGFAMPAGGTFWPALGKAVVTSGLGAGMMFDRGADLAAKSNSVALGAMIAGGANSLLAVPVARQKVANWLLNKTTSGKNELHEKEVEQLLEMFPQLKDELTIGQRTAAPAQLGLESSAARTHGFKSYRRQYEIIRESLEDYGRRWGGEWEPSKLADIAMERGPAAMRALIRDTAKVRKTEYDALHQAARDLMEIESKATVAGTTRISQRLVEMPSLRDDIVKLAREFGLQTDDSGKLLASLSPQMRALLKEFDTFKGEGISLDRLIAARKALNGHKYQASSQLADEAGLAFSAKLKKILDGHVKKMDGEVGDLLRAADASYASRSAEIDAIRKSTVAKSLGLKNAAAEPQAALEALTKLRPQDAARMSRWLSQYDPQLLSEIRGLAWNNAMDKAILSTGTSQTLKAMDVSAFAKEMLEIIGPEPRRIGRATGRGAKSLGDTMKDFESLFPPGEVAEIRFILGKLQDINIAPPRGGTNLDPTAMFQTVIGAVPGFSGKNLDSLRRAAPFLAKQYYQWAFAKHPDRLLFTKEGRALILESYKAKGDYDRWQRVVARTIAWVNSGDPIAGELYEDLTGDSP